MAEALTFLINPPSPRGKTVNREGAGGLGVVLEEPRGFAYPAHRLAEANLTVNEGRVRVVDLVLAPRRGRWQLRRLRRANRVMVQVSRASLDHDLEVIERLRRRAPEAEWHVTGVALQEVAETIESRLPGASWDDAVTGYEAAALMLGRDPVQARESGEVIGVHWPGVPLGRNRRVSIYFGRGCTHACGYCPYVAATGRRHATRHPGYTVSEFRNAVMHCRPRRIVFRDPTFGLDEAATRELLDILAMNEASYRVPFEIESRPELLRGDMVEKLAAAGCVEIKLGVETLEASALIATGRVADAAAAAEYVAAVDEVMERAAEHDITVRVFLLKTLPGATSEGEAAAARRFAGHEPLVIKPVQVMPGAPGPVIGA